MKTIKKTTVRRPYSWAKEKTKSYNKNLLGVDHAIGQVVGFLLGSIAFYFTVCLGTAVWKAMRGY